jgi:hypothetical protein
MVLHMSVMSMETSVWLATHIHMAFFAVADQEQLIECPEDRALHNSQIQVHGNDAGSSGVKLRWSLTEVTTSLMMQLHLVLQCWIA